MLDADDLEQFKKIQNVKKLRNDPLISVREQLRLERALTRHPKTRPYANAYQLVIHKLDIDEEKLDKPEIKRLLWIALQSTAQESLKHLNASDALEALEMNHIAGLARNELLDSYQKNSKTAWLTALGLALVLPLPLKGPVSAGGLGFGITVESLSREKRYEGPDLERINPDIINLEFLNKMDERHIHADPRYHRKAVNDAGAILRLNEEDCKVFIEARLKKMETRIQASFKENAQLLQEIRALQLEEAKRAAVFKKAQDFEATMQNVKLTCKFLGDLGRLGNKHLQHISVVGNALADMWSGCHKLSTALAIPQAGIQGAFALAAGPAAILSAGCAIFELFREDNSNEVFQIMLEHMQIISQQLQDLCKQMAGSFNQVFENQRVILETVIKGFNHLDKLIRTESRDLRVPVLNALDNVQIDLQRLSELVNFGFKELLIQNLKKAMRDSLRAKLTPTEITETNNALLDWIIPQGDIPPESASQLLTGAALFNAKDLESLSALTNKIINKIDANSLSNLIGYLTYYPSALGVPFNIPQDAELDLKTLCNPLLWQISTTKYLPFRKKYKELIVERDSENKDLKKIEKMGENILVIVDSIQRTPELFAKLFQECKKELDQIKDSVKDAFSEKSDECCQLADAAKDLFGNLDVVGDAKNALKMVAHGIPTNHNVEEKYHPLVKGQTVDDFLSLLSIGTKKVRQKLRPKEYKYIPPEFILLEKFNLGSFEMIYKIVKLGDPWAKKLVILDLNIAFKYHSDNTQVIIGTIRYDISNRYDGTHNNRKCDHNYFQVGMKTPDAENIVTHLWERMQYVKTIQSFDQQAIDAATKAIDLYLLRHRKLAVESEPCKTNIKNQLNYLEGNLKLLQAYAEIAGFRDEELNSIKLLVNKISLGIKKFLENPDIHQAWLAEIDKAMQEVEARIKEILEKYGKAIQKPYFQSTISNRIRHVLFQLSKMQAEEAKAALSLSGPPEFKQPLPKSKKQKKSKPSPQDERQSLSAQDRLHHNAAEYGYKCIDMPHDGNCFFHGIIHQIQLQNDKLPKSFLEYTHTKLRNLVKNHLLSYRDKYQDFVIKEEHKDLKGYISYIKKDGKWTDNIAIQALARELKVTIVLIRSDNGPPTIFKPANSIATFYLGYEVGSHYQALSLDPTLKIEKSIADLIKLTKTDDFVGNKNVLKKSQSHFLFRNKPIVSQPDRNPVDSLRQEMKAQNL